MVFQNAEHSRRELFQQWRWLHGRAALQAEWAAQTAKYEEKERQRAAKRKATNTLPKMLREKPFEHWRAHWGMRPVRAVQAAFRTATQELIDVGAKGAKRAKEHVFARLVAELNAIDDRLGCIETGEREDLVARIEEMAGLVGLDNQDERLTGTRDW